MGKTCLICGTYLTKADIKDFNRFTRKFIAEFVGITIDKVDPKSKLTCESCGNEFCKSCYHTKRYNGKSLSSFVQTYGPAYQSTEKRSYVVDHYVCENCEKEVNLHCHTCGKLLGSDEEFIFSGHHHGFHIKCEKCKALICLDCATEPKKPKKYLKRCPFCNEKKWLNKRTDMLLTNYDNNIMFLSRSIGKKCFSCHKEPNILLICSNQKCKQIYCPQCLVKAEKRNLSICPSCGKAGFREYKKKIPKWNEQFELLKIEDINSSDATRKEKLEKNGTVNEKDGPHEEKIDISLLPDPLQDDPSIENEIPKKRPAPTPLSKIQELAHQTQIIRNSEQKTISQQDPDSPLQQLPSDISQKIKHFITLCNSSEDIGLFMESEDFVIQFYLKGYEGFYLRLARGRMYQKTGTYPLATVQSDIINIENLQRLLAGQEENLIGILHGNEEHISTFLDIYDAFYEQVT
ncbi:hypothetical protein NEF87_005115 [Candidatus Lokiarchaeum ossiferum]|uniref:RING-type domain-containing protein n=1 Tax=Candidatus Lokiarchaeum ossiferum TaxID=2951803 RepID=A0ABY6HZJ1_9ARCH|nr:hypothetical protein NEF87_005115 [Candidatus Lokiarchaeum sp. B-35]